MNLKYYYWYFSKVLPEKFCDDVIKFANLQKEYIAVTGKYKPETIKEKELLDVKKKRDSNVIWLDEKWIYKELQPYINIANKNAGWNFQWNFSEQCQFTKYKLNQFYDWHCDSWVEPYSMDNNNINYRGKIRKLSMSVCLSDEKDYKGGELEFQTRNLDDPNHTVECKEIKQKGSIVVFPSFVWHRVKPVTEGTRYSLVLWNLGDPWI